jgi:DNA adenine methylase
MNDNELNKTIAPFFMWAGGKTKMLKRYQPIWPHGHYSTYVEPFLGGASVFSWLCNNGDAFDNIVLNDINTEIISVFEAVKNDSETFIKESSDIAKPLIDIPVEDKEVRKKFYYSLRQSYWDNPTIPTLYVLMRLGFNGIWQTCAKSKGLFGTPAGLLNQTRLSQIVNEDIITAWHNQLHNANIYSKDYADISFDPQDSLIYLDPPYRGSFTTYGVEFDDDEQKRICEWSLELASKGATVLLANRDNGDGFFEKIIGDNGTFHYFDVTYTAGRRKKNDTGYEAKAAREFLAIIK